MLAYWNRRLFDFQSDDELMDEFTALMVFAIAFADEVSIIQELSEQLGVGVATEHYRSKYTATALALDPRSAADHFVVLRASCRRPRRAPTHS